MPFAQYRVGVTSSDDFPVRIDIVREALDGLAEVANESMPFRPLSPQEEEDFGERLASYDGLLVRSGIFSETLLKKLRCARVIAVHGAGVDQVDVKAAERLGICVANAPGANANAVIELTMCLMIDLVRRVSLSACRVRRDMQWGDARYLGGELRGRTLGLLGFGRIGTGVAARAKAFGMDIVVYDPYVPAERLMSCGVRASASVEEVLELADVVSLHLPIEQETSHLINDARIRRMRQGALLINTARGALVDEKALYEALVSGHLGGAALDVLEQEPPDPTNPLLSLDSVVVTPHLGGSTREALRDIARIASEQIRAALMGRTPEYAVNRPSAPRFKSGQHLQKGG